MANRGMIRAGRPRGECKENGEGRSGGRLHPNRRSGVVEERARPEVAGCRVLSSDGRSSLGTRGLRRGDRTWTTGSVYQREGASSAVP